MVAITRIIVTTFLLLLLGVSVLLPIFASAQQFNQQINYQGKLTDAAGLAVANGPYQMVFRLYTVSTGGAAIWTETLSGTNRVTVTNGLFSIMLGSTTALSGVNFNQTLYLGVTIEADAEMSPRKIIGAVPAAFEAKNTQTFGTLATTSFLRSDQSTSLLANVASTLLTVTQNGIGDILNMFDGATEVFTILDGGNVGIGSTSPGARLSVAGAGFFAGDLTSAGATTLSTTTITTLNLTNALPITSGGTGATASSGARTNLGATTVGSNLFTLTNPSAITFPRFNADNTVSALDATAFRTAIGAGVGGGSVTSVALSVPTGFSVANSPVTGSGSLDITYAAGFEGLRTASSTNWNSFYNTPSTRITDGTGLTWTGNTLAVTTNGISDTLLRQGAALSVIGRGVNSLGNVADITAGTDGFVLRRSGTTLGFGTISNNSLAAGSYTNVTGVGALDAGSITSNFGNINIGASTFTTTGAMNTGTLTATNATTKATATVDMLMMASVLKCMERCSMAVDTRPGAARRNVAASATDIGNTSGCP